MAPRTVALYQQDQKLREHTAKIVNVHAVSSLSEASRMLFKQVSEEDLIVITAETIMYAQGGGQPSDTGVMRSLDPENPTIFEVSSVRSASDGQILHLGRYTTTTAKPFVIGDLVHQVIDVEKRELHSRIHTGGHLVSLAVRQLAESIPDVSELKAQHYPDAAFVDFRGLIDGKHKESIQTKVNELIQRALLIEVCWLTETELRGKCAIVPEAVAIPEGELVRVVDIVGAGACPCGGTHVPDSSQVGKVLVKKISRSKGNSKISYSIG